MRIDRDAFREILATLSRNRRRTLLTGFGVFWGMFMLLALIGGGDALKAMLSRNFEGFATNSAFVYAQNTSKPYKGFDKGRKWDICISDADRLKAMVPEIDVVALSSDTWDSTISYDETAFTGGSVSGITPEHQAIEPPKIKYGRYINQMDLKRESKVCVLGLRVYENLFPDGGDPCGKYIKLGSVYFQVVGVNVTESDGIVVNGRSDSKVSIPLTVFQKLYNRGDRVDILGFTVRPGYRAEDLEPRVREVIALPHNVDPTDKQGVGIFSLELIFGLMDSLFRGLDILMLLVGAGTIMAGAIGVSNIMMVTVKERTTEIGIRRAIGATPSMILSQIIVESLLLTLVSGMLGIVFSVFVLNLADMIAQASGQAASFQITIYDALAAMGFLALLGALTGLAPASRAMKIKPVDAMRDE